jgi:hypothetical protein
VKPSIEFSDTNGPAFFFYQDHLVRLGGFPEFGRPREWNRSTFVGSTDADGKLVEAVHLKLADGGYTLDGSAFEFFRAVATETVSNLCNKGWGHELSFEALGKRSIDIRANDLGDPIGSVKCVAVPDDCLDQRERIVDALNRAKSSLQAYFRNR